MNSLTPEKVRDFLLAKYAGAMTDIGVDLGNVPDDFDFLLSGVIDSFGILEMINAIEDEFGIQFDMESLDAEQMTVLGPLARFVASNAIAA